MLRSVTIISRIGQSAHMYDLVLFVIIWSQVGQEIEDLDLNGGS